MIASVSREDLAVATGSTSFLACPLSVCARADPGIVLAVTYLFRTTGQVIGVSLSGALLQAILTTKLRERIQGPNAFEVRPVFRSSRMHGQRAYRDGHDVVCILDHRADTVSGFPPSRVHGCVSDVAVQSFNDHHPPAQSGAAEGGRGLVRRRAARGVYLPGRAQLYVLPVLSADPRKSTTVRIASAPLCPLDAHSHVLVQWKPRRTGGSVEAERFEPDRVGRGRESMMMYTLD